MRVLLVHNYYQQPGGEDEVFAAEGGLLRRFGHEVIEYTQDNLQIKRMNTLAVAARAVWSVPARRRLRALIGKHRPAVAHFHNTFPLISPAAYYTCRNEGVAVVQTLHNYRLLCPQAVFFRSGRTCTDCLARTVAWPGVVHGCYRNSRASTAVVALLQAAHGRLGTYRRQVDLFIVLSQFGRELFVRGGLPSSRIRVKPHFVHPDPGVGSGEGEYALFVGRLSEQKGLRLLLEAWRGLRQIPLKIVGDGPLAREIGEFAHRHPELQLESAGRRSAAEVGNLLKKARFLVFPSGGYESFGRVVAEAFACGRPVIASDQGALRELVRDGHTGLLFRPGDAGELAAKARLLWGRLDERSRMGRNARAEYEARYSADANYSRLVGIYEEAIRLSRRNARGRQAGQPRRIS